MAALPRPIAIGFAIGALSGLAGCAGAPGSAGSGPPAEAPAYRVGDRWVYHGDDGFRVKTEWEETHEVTAIGAEGVAARITLKGGLDVTRMEQWSAPGQVKVGAVYDNTTRRFDAPLQRYDFPLAPGKVWNQWVWNFNEFTKERGQINRYVNVSGWEKVTTPAGTFDAIKMQVIMRLDDETFWRYATTCNYAVWYAPAVKAVVREERAAQYVEKSNDSSGGAGTIRTQFGVVELMSFAPGR
ncbi:MAG TPA: hypothetical protein VFJ68_00885 [Casimicrobiaceae bacterium]|nr:hypothetical protein [Casimicrobiaceae bacterium]